MGHVPSSGNCMSHVNGVSDVNERMTPLYVFFFLWKCDCWEVTLPLCLICWSIFHEFVFEGAASSLTMQG